MKKTEETVFVGEVVEERIDGGMALTAVTRAEIDTQIATARAYPRSIKEFKRTAMELACLDEDTASSMFYALPRGGKTIQGPSVRLAEVVMSCWGNIRAEADIVAIDHSFVTAMGSCIDLEKNVANRIRVKRRITDKNGKRFNDDMIAVTSNAASSIAFREAVFKVVPRALVKDIYEAAKKTAVGDVKTIASRRSSAFEWFAKNGIKQEQILQKVGRKGVEDVTLDDLAILTGMKTAIKDEGASIDELFAPENARSGQSDAAKALADRLREAQVPPNSANATNLANGGTHPTIEESNGHTELPDGS